MIERWRISARGARLDPREGRWVTFEDHRAELERLIGLLEDHDPGLAEIVRGEMGEIPDVPEERPRVMHAIGGPFGGYSSEEARAAARAAAEAARDSSR